MRAIISIASALAATLATAGDIAQAPNTPTKPAVDIVHGRPIEDSYRWLERLDDPAVVSWARQQQDYTKAVLGGIAADVVRDTIPSTARETPMEASRYRRLPSGKSIFLARMEQDSVDALYVRSAGGAIRRVFTPASVGDGKTRTIAFFAPAPDERHVALAIGENGSEDNALYVLDLQSGQLIDGPIPGVRFQAISWWPDSRRFVYPRLRNTEPGPSDATLYVGQQVYAHAIGTDWRMDRVIFGSAVRGSSDVPEGDFPEVELHADVSLALGRHFAGVAQEFGLYVAPLESLDDAHVPWRRLFDSNAGYGTLRTTGSAPLAVLDGRIYLTHIADKGEIHSIDPVSPNRPVIHFSDPDTALLAMVPTAEGLYLQTQEGMRQRLLHFDPRRHSISPIILPFEGQFDLVRGDPHIQGALLRDRRWTTRSRFWSVQANVVSELAIVSTPSDGIELTAQEVEVQSIDGTRVPLSIVHPRSWNRAQPLPFLLTGYAAYGINMRPTFNDNLVPIYRDGIGYAVCHARGGGERGDAWHRAAMKATKHLSWEDFIACARWLIEQGYTQADRLVAEGGSAGGMMVGRAMTERPDLFAGVHLAYGGLNPIRAESHANGRPNVAEFGTIHDPDEARWIYDMDTYHHIRRGVAYPAVLLTHGWNDARTPFWMSAKTAAHLQASTTSGKPILMNIDFKGGHQITSGDNSEVADTKTVIRAFFRLVLLDSP